MQIRDRLDIPTDDLATLCLHHDVHELALFGLSVDVVPRGEGE